MQLTVWLESSVLCQDCHKQLQAGPSSEKAHYTFCARHQRGLELEIQSIDLNNDIPMCVCVWGGRGWKEAIDSKHSNIIINQCVFVLHVRVIGKGNVTCWGRR